MDESGASVGHATCSGFETGGWTVNTQAGPLARFVAAHQQALLQQQDLRAASTVNPAPVVAAGNAALASAWNSISTAQGQGQTINAEAQALAATAQSLASQHGC
jgi:hypothetical protein